MNNTSSCILVSILQKIIDLMNKESFCIFMNQIGAKDDG